MREKRGTINRYYRDVVHHGEIHARDWITPMDVKPVNGWLFPDAFGKAEAEAAAVLVVRYAQTVECWAPFRLAELVAWVRSRVDHDKSIQALVSNPFLRVDLGFGILRERGFLLPVNGDAVEADRLAHVTNEFILRCFLSSQHLNPRKSPVPLEVLEAWGSVFYSLKQVIDAPNPAE